MAATPKKAAKAAPGKADSKADRDTETAPEAADDKTTKRDAAETAPETATGTGSLGEQPASPGPDAPTAEKVNPVEEAPAPTYQSPQDAATEAEGTPNYANHPDRTGDRKAEAEAAGNDSVLREDQGIGPRGPDEPAEDGQVFGVAGGPDRADALIETSDGGLVEDNGDAYRTDDKLTAVRAPTLFGAEFQGLEDEDGKSVSVGSLFENESGSPTTVTAKQRVYAVVLPRNTTTPTRHLLYAKGQVVPITEAEEVKASLGR